MENFWREKDWSQAFRIECSRRRSTLRYTSFLSFSPEWGK
jgi:hypothetical protein